MTTTETKTPPLFLTVTDVASMMFTDPRTIRRGIENGEIPAARIGNTVRIPTDLFCEMTGTTPDAVVEYLTGDGFWVHYRRGDLVRH